jgi:hypothetical protein
MIRTFSRITLLTDTSKNQSQHISGVISHWSPKYKLFFSGSLLSRGGAYDFDTIELKLAHV